METDMGTSLWDICAKEVNVLKEKNIPHDGRRTAIFYYMLYDNLNLLQEFQHSELYCGSQGSSMTGDRTLAFFPNYKTKANTEYGLPIYKHLQDPNFVFSQKALTYMNQLCDAIEARGALVEKDICNEGSFLESYVVFSVKLFNRACLDNSLIKATNENYVKGLSEEEFSSLKARVGLYVSLVQLDIEIETYNNEEERLKGARQLLNDLEVIYQRMDLFRRQDNKNKLTDSEFGLFKKQNLSDSSSSQGTDAQLVNNP